MKNFKKIDEVINWISDLILKFFFVILIILLILVGFYYSREYDKDIVKEAIQENNK